MFISRPKVFHGKDYRTTNTMTDQRIRGRANLVASNIHTLKNHNSDVTTIAFSQTTLATCSADKTIRLWDVKDFAELPISPLHGHALSINCCSFSPSGSTLATCSTDGTLRLWDMKSGQGAALLTHQVTNAIRVCQFSYDGRMIVTGGDDDLACLWNVMEGKLIRSLQGHEETVTSAAFSPDGMFVVTASSGGDYGGELCIWDAEFGHGRYLARIKECHDLGVTCTQFSPIHGGPSEDSKKQFLLATCGQDNLIKLWTLDCVIGSVDVTVKLKTMLPGHGDSVLWICFSHDGAFLASSSLDKTVRLWSLETQQLLVVLDSHSSYVSSCAFSLDGKYLATASNDQTVKIWQLTDTTGIMDGLSGYEAEEGDNEESVFSQVAMESWSVEEVGRWLDWLGLKEYMEVFQKNAIDGKELLALTPTDLEKSLGIEALGHRNKIIRGRITAEQQPISSVAKERKNMPDEFICPISHEMMKDPVIASDGYTYDRPAIMAWMRKGETRSPMTNIQLASTNLTPNRTIKMMIQKYLQQ